MWFITRNIFEYLCNEDIPKEKRVKVLNKCKKRIINDLSKMTPEEVIKLLFQTETLRELKVIICERINEMSDDSTRENELFIKKLINEFEKLKEYKEKYVLSDTVPDVIKKVVIDVLYGKKLYDLVKDGKVSKKVRRVIIKLSLSGYDLTRLLKKNIPIDLKEYILDECLESNYAIRSVLEDSNVNPKLKERLVAKRINKDNLFNIIEYANSDTIDYLLELKANEFDVYLKSLNHNNILSVINDSKTPSAIIDYIFKYKADIIETAVDKAWKNTIENTIYNEKNVQVLNIIFERRQKTVYRILNEIYEFQLLPFLNLEHLPDVYKDYIVNKRKRALKYAISRLTGYEVTKYLSKDSRVPEEIKEYIFDNNRETIIKYYAKEDDNEIVKSIRLSSLGTQIKRLLIEQRVNDNNVFELLNEYFIDKETVDLTLELKKDIIVKILLSHDNDKLFKGKFGSLKEDVVESLLVSNQDLLRERITLLSEDDLYKYLSSSSVLDVVKKLILERFDIDSDNAKNVLILMSMYDMKIVLDNYDDIKDLILGLGIDFDSFLQYGSGSQKHSKWLDGLLEIIFDDDIGDFALCKDYLFNNYYDVKNENSVYMIASFLEYIDNYSKYKDLFINLINDDVKLNKEDRDSLRFLFNVSSLDKNDAPKSIGELKKFKLELYKNYITFIKDPFADVDDLQSIFNNVLFSNARDILANIGGTGALRTLKKDNINSPTVVQLIDELMVYSSIIEMVNYTNNKEGLRSVLTYIFSDIDLLTKIQNMFYVFEDKVRKLYELDSMNNLTTISEARRLDMLDEELSLKYGGEVFNYSDKNYCLYGHVLSYRENIEDMLNGVSTGNSNFISVSPVSYRGQKYYFDRDDVILAYDKIPRRNFICSSVANMGSNYSVRANSSEVGNIRRSQRGILETSAVVERNAEALLYREGVRPCGLILPGGRKPTKKELDIHKKYGLPFIITQQLHKSIDDPKYLFVNDLELDSVSTDLEELKFISEMLKPNVSRVKESDSYTGREVAVFADCHSMYEPTLAILEDMKRKGISEIYSLGDNVGLGPNPVEVFDLLDEFGVKSVAGNAEYYNTIGTDAFPYLNDGRLESQLWTERKLGPERIKNLRLYPSSMDIVMGGKKIALCHFANDVRWDFRERSVHSYSAPHGNSNTEQLRYTNSEEAIRKVTNCVVSNKGNISAVKGYMASKDEPIFGGKLVTDYDYVLQGHYHFELDDLLDDTEVLTLRAVGMGYEGSERENEACYYILRERKDGDIDIEKVYVSFNRNALLSSIHTCDLPSKDRVLSYVKKSR